MDEAETHLNELIQADPTDGVANLAMARIANRRGSATEAEMYFHRAIYGFWPANAEGDRLEARLELVDLLAKRGEKQALLAELLLLRRDVPEDAKLKNRVGHLFLLANSPARAAEVFREVLQKNHQDAEALAGLGQAEFAEGDYVSAQMALRSAVRLNAGDSGSQRRLEICNQILALDPTLQGLKSAEKYLRSRRLVVLVSSKLELCIATQREPAASSIQDLRGETQKLLAHRGKPRESGDAIEVNLTLAEQLWQARHNLCPQAVENEDPVALVLAKISQPTQG